MLERSCTCDPLMVVAFLKGTTLKKLPYCRIARRKCAQTICELVHMYIRARLILVFILYKRYLKLYNCTIESHFTLFYAPLFILPMIELAEALSALLHLLNSPTITFHRSIQKDSRRLFKKICQWGRTGNPAQSSILQVCKVYSHLQILTRKLQNSKNSSWRLIWAWFPFRRKKLK